MNWRMELSNYTVACGQLGFLKCTRNQRAVNIACGDYSLWAPKII